MDGSLLLSSIIRIRQFIALKVKSKKLPAEKLDNNISTGRLLINKE